MKNKKRCMAILLIFCILTVGCSSEPARPSSITFENLPGEIAYNDTIITLSDVSFCEVYTESDHGYTGYCIVTVDRSNLTDDDVYWMLKQDLREPQAEFEVNAYLTSEINSLELERMSLLQRIYNDKNIYFVFFTDDIQREHLNDFKLSLQMIISPEKSLAAASTQSYYFDFNAEEGVDYSDYNSVLSEKESDILVDALKAYIEDLKQRNSLYYPR